MRARSAANSAASSPPTPARISTIVLRESFPSGGTMPKRTFCSSFAQAGRSVSSSSRAISAISGSALLFAMASASARSRASLRHCSPSASKPRRRECSRVSSCARWALL